MSHKARFFSTAFLAGVVAGGAAMLFFAPHPLKGSPVGQRHARSVDNDGLEDWSGQFSAYQGAGDLTLSPAPMGWY